MPKKYTPIISPATKKTFFNYIHNINFSLIDYFTIGVQSAITKRSISIMSSIDWQKKFTFNKYAESDPLRSVVLKTNRRLILFDEIDYIDNFGKEIMHQRSRHNIKNGIVLVDRFDSYNYMITLGTGFAKFNGADFINKYIKDINNVKKDLIKVINEDAMDFLKKEIIYP